MLSHTRSVAAAASALTRSYFTRSLVVCSNGISQSTSNGSQTASPPSYQQQPRQQQLPLLLSRQQTAFLSTSKVALRHSHGAGGAAPASTATTTAATGALAPITFIDARTNEIAFRSPLPDIPSLPEVSLYDFLFQAIRKRDPNRVILSNAFNKDQNITYGALAANSNALAAGLYHDVGVREGDVVGILLPNSVEFYYGFFGTIAVSATATLINPSYEPREIAFQLKDSGARVLITTAAFLDKIHAVIADKKNNGASLTHVIVVSDGHGHRNEQHHGKGNPLHSSHLSPVEAQKLKEHPHKKAHDPSESVQMIPLSTLIEHGKEKPEFPRGKANVYRDIVVLPYSSGTTGLPKGVCLTNHNLVSNILQFLTLESHLDGKKDTFIGVLPYFHIYGFMIGLIALYRDIKIVLMEKFDFAKFLETIQENHVTIAHVAPPVVLALAKHPLVDKFNIKTMRQLFSGAAPLSKDLEDQVVKRLHVQVKQAYGMTETSPMASCNPDQKTKSGSVGILAPNTKAKIFDHISGKCVGPNEEGELLLKGPQVMLGYWKRTDATSVTIDDNGYLHTGDIAKIDEEGYIYIVDRVKELIKVKGFQVAPAELEGILLSHAGIADAAVVGKPDEHSGELPVAFVVKKPTHAHVGEKEIDEFVAAQVSNHKRLKDVRFIDAIPKSASGKILRRVLRDQLKDELAKGKQ